MRPLGNAPVNSLLGRCSGRAESRLQPRNLRLQNSWTHPRERSGTTVLVAWSAVSMAQAE